MTKILILIFLAQIGIVLYLGYGLWKDKTLSMDLGNTIIVGTTTDYTAPIGYFEYYMGQENGYQNKYFGYYMSQYNIGVDN